MSSPISTPSAAPGGATPGREAAAVRGRAPSKRWYRVSVLVAVVGVLAALAWWPYATTRIYYATERFARTRTVGGSVTLASAGTHTFWIEGGCMSCAGNDASEYREVAVVSLTGPGGRPVAVEPIRRGWTFNTAKREGRALWTFDAPEAGRYDVAFDLETTGRDWDNNYPSALAFSPGVGLPVRILWPMLALAAGGIGVGLGLAVLTAARRRRYYDRRYGRDPH